MWDYAATEEWRVYTSFYYEVLPPSSTLDLFMETIEQFLCLNSPLVLHPPPRLITHDLVIAVDSERNVFLCVFTPRNLRLLRFYNYCQLLQLRFRSGFLPSRTKIGAISFIFLTLENNKLCGSGPRCRFIASPGTGDSIHGYIPPVYSGSHLKSYSGKVTRGGGVCESHNRLVIAHTHTHKTCEKKEC